MEKDLASIRRDYKLKEFTEKEAAADPYLQFSRWFDEATDSGIDEVNAMTLATATVEAVPDARIVLLKGVDEKGFVFFTNYASAKGQELTENPRACLVFFWKELERQVRITGMIEKVSTDESDAYFKSRPLGSRIGAWTSPQSEVIPNREWLENKYSEQSKAFENGEVPRPPFWGGYRVKPVHIEFWQGRSSRLHDRLVYTLEAANSWKRERLAP